MQKRQTETKVSRVLVVEDDTGIVEVYRDVLKDLCSVTACETITEASSTLQADTFDLIILDLGLPDGHGLSLLAETRKRYPALPVIVVSGDCYGVMAERVMDAGATACFVKPFEYDELEQAVAGVVK